MVGLASLSAVFSLFLLPWEGRISPFSPSSKNTTSLKNILNHVYVCVCVSMRVSSGLQIPLVLELKLRSLAERYTLLTPALSSCSSLTLNSGDGRYTGCAYGRLRERGLSFSKSGVYMVGRLHWSRHMHAAWSTDPACWKSTIAFYSMFCPLHPSGMTDFGEVCHSPRVPAS